MKAVFALLSAACFLIGCSSEVLRRQEDLIQRQQAEILEQEKEIQQLELALKREGQKRRDCNRAFRLFEQGQGATDPAAAVDLYRQGLALCPDDEVAHYELGKLLAGMGRIDEAALEFKAAIKLNPKLQAAREQLKMIERP
jgi:tetratricopeptide (TPR) repeat protein